MSKKPKLEVNRFRVPARQWAKWDETGRRVFNETYEAMSMNPRLFMHTKAGDISRRDWLVTCWNAAWHAASAAKGEAPTEIIMLRGGKPTGERYIMRKAA